MEVLRKPRPKWKSALTVAVVLVGSAVVLAGSALTVATTTWGGERLRRYLLPRINDGLDGEIEIRRLRISASRIAVEGVSLRDPQGGEVAVVERIEVGYSLFGLLHRRLELSQVSVVRPQLRLRVEPGGGTNLQRALANRQQPTTPATIGHTTGQNARDTRGSAWEVRLDALQVRVGRVDLRDVRTDATGTLRHLDLDNVNVHGAGRLGGGPENQFLVRVEAEGEFQEPLHTPFNATVHGRGSLGPWVAAWAEGSVAVNVGDSLAAKGGATWNGGTGALALKADVDAVGARLAVQLFAHPRAGAMDRLSVSGRGINLARLAAAGVAANLVSDLYPELSSDLAFDLEAHGEGTSWGKLHGAARLSIPAGRLGGQTLGPVRLRATADQGTIKMMELFALLPGATISGAGEASLDAMSLRTTVDLHDLGALVRSATARYPARAPRVAGRGQIEVTASGNLRGPSLRVSARLAGLQWQEVRIPDLQLVATVPDLGRPLSSNVSLDIPLAYVGARRFRGLGLRLGTHAGRLKATMWLAEPEALRLSAAGRWRSGLSEIDFDRWTMASSRGTWTLVRPARGAWTRDRVRLAGLEWRSEDRQTLQLDVDKQASGLDAQLVLSRFDLSRVPGSLLPADMKLAGRVHADLHVRQRQNDLRGDARIVLAQGHVGNLDNLALTTEVHWAKSRVSGTMDVGAIGARVAGTFDLPVAWPPSARSSLAADLTLTDLDVRRLAAILPKRMPAPVRGLASARVNLSGTGDSPELLLSAGIRQLSINGVAVGDLTAHIEAHKHEPLVAQVELVGMPSRESGGLPARNTLSVRSGFALASLARHFPSTEQLVSTPIHLECNIAGLDLSLLAAAAHWPGKLNGEGSLVASLDGPPRSAKGRIDLHLAKISSSGFPATDVVFRADLAERETQADLRVSRRGAPLLSVDARAGGPLSRLRIPSDLATTPVEAHAVLGPLDWRRDGLMPASVRRATRVLRGRLQADGKVSGTMGAPILNLRAEASDLRLDDKHLGEGVALLKYADRKASSEVTLHSANGGQLQLTATIDHDLGSQAKMGDHGWQLLPVTARLVATDLDLSGLSGATPGLRAVSGEMLADIALTGTLGDPQPSGRLEWKNGGITVTGMGEYKHVHLLAHGTRDRLVLEELSAESGGGHARITASGDHQAGGGYGTHATMDLERFPAYVEGQAIATLSLKASAESQVSIRKIQSSITISSARLALSDAKRRHLQKTAQPDDVILVEDGVPLDPAQAHKLEEWNRKLAQALSPDTVVGTPATDSAKQAPRGILLLSAPRNLWVSGKDANLELALQPGFRVELGDRTRVYGQVLIKRGRVDVVGRRFDLKSDSSLLFAGDPEAPDLDITAEHINEQERITVVATIKGSPSHLQTSLSAPSRPDLAESQLYTLIVTGHLALGGGTASPTTPGDRAASLVGGLMAGQLQKMVAKKLPLDVLTIEGGNAPGSARLEAGTYLTSNLYVGYVGRLGAEPILLENRNAVHLEYELGSRWSFQGEYGDAKTGSADIIWTKRY